MSFRHDPTEVAVLFWLLVLVAMKGSWGAFDPSRIRLFFGGGTASFPGRFGGPWHWLVTWPSNIRQFFSTRQKMLGTSLGQLRDDAKEVLQRWSRFEYCVLSYRSTAGVDYSYCALFRARLCESFAVVCLAKYVYPTPPSEISANPPTRTRPRPNPGEGGGASPEMAWSEIGCDALHDIRRLEMHRERCLGLSICLASRLVRRPLGMRGGTRSGSLLAGARVVAREGVPFFPTENGRPNGNLTNIS